MSIGETSTGTYGFANSPVMVESFGNIFGLGEDVADDDVDDEGVGVSVQEIIPIRKMSPVKYFIAKKYGFSGSTPKRWCLAKFEK